MILEKFKRGLSLIDDSNISNAEVIFSVDRKFPSSYLIDIDPENDGSPMINCCIDGRTVNLYLSAFDPRNEPELDNGAFILKDDDGIIRGVRFHLTCILSFGGD